MHSTGEHARLYLLRVGADSSKVGGCFCSPIFEDRTYLFVPITITETEKVIPDKTVTYGNYKWNGMSVLEYIPPAIAMQPVHNDPEFSTFTYGSPRYVKYARGNREEKNYNKLKSMNPGDILVFYAAFKNVLPSRNDSMNGLYYCFFSYFVVQKAVCYSDPSLIEEEYKQSVAGNHHFIHNYRDQVIIVGDRDKSRVLNKAVLLSSPQDRCESNYYPSRSMSQKLGGYYKALNRSSLRRMLSPNIALPFKEYLDHLGFD